MTLENKKIFKVFGSMFITGGIMYLIGMPFFVVMISSALAGLIAEK